jgi:hypothetical protein
VQSVSHRQAQQWHGEVEAVLQQVVEGVLHEEPAVGLVVAVVGPVVRVPVALMDQGIDVAVLCAGGSRR